MLARAASGSACGRATVACIASANDALEQFDHGSQRGRRSREKATATSNSNVITMAIGGREKPGSRADSFDVQLGDRFLLCSDGLYREMHRAGDRASWRTAISTVVGAQRDTLQGEAADNVTAVVVDAQPGATADAVGAAIDHGDACDDLVRTAAIAVLRGEAQFEELGGTAWTRRWPTRRHSRPGSSRTGCPVRS